MDLTKILKVYDTIYSPLGGDGLVVSINHTSTLPIKIQWRNGDWSSFTKDGKYFTFSTECLLFPSKENRDWNTISKFKNGDVIVSECGNIAIFSHLGTIENRNDVVFYHSVNNINISINNSNKSTNYADNFR